MSKKKMSGNIYIAIVGALIIIAIILGVFALTDNLFIGEKNESMNNNSVNNQTSAQSNSIHAGSSFKSCSSGTVWGCKQVTQGENTGTQATGVCGCIPTCSSGLHLVVSNSNDVWPDGSKKGLFECSKELPA